MKLLHALTAATILTVTEYARAIQVSVGSGLESSYDYIVVGGGTSGLVVGTRLAEDKEKKVLIVEAGPFDQYEEYIYYPHYVLAAVGTDYDWKFRSLPQEYMANGNATVARGKVVGGSSILNGMVFDRGAPGDYDAWEKLGNPGWGWEGILPYFKKSETFTPPIAPMASAFNITHVPDVHGTEGPVRSSYPPYLYESAVNTKDAFNSLGIESPMDQAESALGSFFHPTSLDPVTQTRSSARTAYWDPSADWENLHIMTSTMVLKIVTDTSSETPKATGVEIQPDGGETMTVDATQDVVLAAGSVQSPQLLQVSGIGRKSLLDSLDIPVVVDLPGVGENFQDHPVMSAPWFTTNVSWSAANLTTNRALDYIFRRMYETTLTGPWTVGVGNILTFLPLKEFAENAEDLITALRNQNSTFLADDADSTLTAGYIRQKEVTLEMWEQNTASALEILAPGLTIVLQHVLSRGSIYIDSPDMRQPPRIDWRALTNPIDRQLFLSAFRFGRVVNMTPPMQQLGVIEGPQARLQTDEEILEYIYRSSRPSIAHPSGTCSMMPLDLGGVVDPNLRVHGIDGIRIVDASVMPMIPGAHIQASVYAVAEKAADLIKSS